VGSDERPEPFGEGSLDSTLSDGSACRDLRIGLKGPMDQHAGAAESTSRGRRPSYLLTNKISYCIVSCD
jgi:hypothetical protein